MHSDHLALQRGGRNKKIEHIARGKDQGTCGDTIGLLIIYNQMVGLGAICASYDATTRIFCRILVKVFDPLPSPITCICESLSQIQFVFFASNKGHLCSSICFLFSHFNRGRPLLPYKFGVLECSIKVSHLLVKISGAFPKFYKD